MWAEMKLAWLDWAMAQRGPASLREALEAARNARAAELASGQIVAATSRDGVSVSFSTPSQAGSSPLDMFRLWSELIELYERARNLLGGTPTDEEILAQMKTFLRGEGSPIGLCIGEVW